MTSLTMIGKVLHRHWGYNCSLNDFCLVVDETPRFLVLVKLKKENDSKDGQEGNEWPIVPDLDKEPLPTSGRFRATRKDESPRRPCCSYEGNGYYLWDGKPKPFNGD